MDSELGGLDSERRRLGSERGESDSKRGGLGSEHGGSDYEHGGIDSDHGGGLEKNCIFAKTALKSWYALFFFYLQDSHVWPLLSLRVI